MQTPLRGWWGALSCQQQLLLVVARDMPPDGDTPLPILQVRDWLPGGGPRTSERLSAPSEENPEPACRRPAVCLEDLLGDMQLGRRPLEVLSSSAALRSPMTP